MPSLVPADPALFFSRQDPEDPRLGDFAQVALETSSHSVQIFGWPDDEGIRMNGGRPGAALAPDRIRRFLYKMTPHLDFPGPLQLGDRGNLKPEGNLAARHAVARAQVLQAFNMKSAVLTLGGGHDYGYPDAAAFLEFCESQKTKRPVVLNFDAHLDVRPTDKGFHSGTPFRRLLEEFRGRFEFHEIGLQPQCNSRHHWLWALDQGAHLHSIAELRGPGQLKKILSKNLIELEGHPCWISFDMDAISSRSAPGCSQSWDWGLESQDLLELMTWLQDHLDVRGLGIYEVSPPLDVDDQTSKLAALFAHDFISRKTTSPPSEEA